MKPEEIEQAWEIVYDYTVGDYSAPAYNALRHEMAVQAKMIELMAQDINRLKSELPVMPTNDDLRKTIGERYREQAEAELKGFNEANS